MDTEPVVIDDEESDENDILLVSNESDDEVIPVSETIVLDEQELSSASFGYSNINNHKEQVVDVDEHENIAEQYTCTTEEPDIALIEVLRIDKTFEEDKQLLKFVNKCLQLESSKGMLRILNHTLLNAYVDATEKYKKSFQFRSLLIRTMQVLEKDPYHKFSHVKLIHSHLKKHKRKQIMNPLSLSKVFIEGRKRKKNYINNNSLLKKRKYNTEQVIELDDDYDSTNEKKTKVNEGNTRVESLNSNKENSLTLPVSNAIGNNITASEKLKEPIIVLENKTCIDNNLLTPQKFVACEANTETIEDKIKRIEQIILNYKLKIDELEQTEVDNDESQSPYLQSEKYKTKVLRLYKHLCNLQGVETSTKQHQVRLAVKEGHPEGPAKLLEKFLNQNFDTNGQPQFPDYNDVYDCVVAANIDYKLGWTKREIKFEAHGLFVQCGRALQQRRQRREWRHALRCANPEELASDPADEDPELMAKLMHNRQIAQQKEQKLFGTSYETAEHRSELTLHDEKDDSNSEDEHIPDKEVPLGVNTTCVANGGEKTVTEKSPFGNFRSGNVFNNTALSFSTLSVPTSIRPEFVIHDVAPALPTTSIMSSQIRSACIMNNYLPCLPSQPLMSSNINTSSIIENNSLSQPTGHTSNIRFVFCNGNNGLPSVLLTPSIITTNIRLDNNVISNNQGPLVTSSATRAEYISQSNSSSSCLTPSISKESTHPATNLISTYSHNVKNVMPTEIKKEVKVENSMRTRLLQAIDSLDDDSEINNCVASRVDSGLKSNNMTKENLQSKYYVSINGSDCNIYTHTKKVNLDSSSLVKEINENKDIISFEHTVTSLGEKENDDENCVIKFEGHQDDSIEALIESNVIELPSLTSQGTPEIMFDSLEIKKVPEQNENTDILADIKTECQPVIMDIVKEETTFIAPVNSQPVSEFNQGECNIVKKEFKWTNTLLGSDPFLVIYISSDSDSDEE